MASEEIVLRSPVLDNVVKMVAVDDYPRRRPGKNSLNQMGTVSFGGSAVDEYNGMHKLVLITDNSNPEAPIYKVCVCDGATYNPQTHTSGESRVEVNGVSFDLGSKIFDTDKQVTYVYVLFTAATQGSEATVSYAVGGSLPENSSSSKVYLIGRVVFDSNSKSFSIVQDHKGNSSNGVVCINWGVYCYAF